jgi:hypothetical protein
MAAKAKFAHVWHKVELAAKGPNAARLAADTHRHQAGIPRRLARPVETNRHTEPASVQANAVAQTPR